MTRACIGEVVFGKKRSNNNFLKFRTNLYSYIGNRLVGLSGQISKSEHSSNPSTTSMTATYSYDNNGNIVGDGLENVNFEYDLNNMVTRVKNTLSGDTLTTYSYFADGEKVIVREGGVSTTNSSDYQIVGRRYYGPFTINELTVGQSTVLAFESATQLGGDIVVINNPAYSEATNINSSVNPYLSLFYHKDHLGNTRVITTSAGTILEQNDYYPFGLRTTRNQSYTTLNESLTSMAQSTGNIPSAPIYLYNTKEKQEFIHNTSSLINTQSSATYTSNYLDYGARFYNPVTARWNTQDPMAEKYQRFSPYNYCVNNPINFIDPKGEAWTPTFKTTEDGKVIWTGFMWVDESNSYNEDGSLKEDLFHQAIFFSDNGTFNTSSDRNIGSSTATVYLANGQIRTFTACTKPSDIKQYPTIPEKLYLAYVGLHKKKYEALKLKDKKAILQRIELGGKNPAHPDHSYAEGINIHKAGIGDLTGKSNGATISQGCILISVKEWDDFIKIFVNDEQRSNIVGVIVSRSVNAPTIRNRIKINYIDANIKGKAIIAYR